MTLLPSPELAKAITTVVMDHAERSIERTRTISSAGLEEAILSRLLFLNATAAMSEAGADDEITTCSVRLIRLLFSRVVISTLPPEVEKAIRELRCPLADKGLL